jgi:plastocyanin
MIARTARSIVAPLLAATLMLASSGVAQANTVVKATGSNHWKPAKTVVAKGTKVIWKNPTGSTHTVTSYGGNWSKNVKLAPGSKTSFTFNSSGTYHFRCKIHSTLLNGVCSGMCGVIKVA